MGRARAAAALLLLPAACNGSAHFDLPLAVADEDHGLVLAVRSPSGLSIFAFGKTTGGPAAVDVGDAPADLVILVYEASLRALRLDPGPLAIARPGDPGHVLRAPDRVFSARVQRRSIGGWTEVDGLPPDLVSLRVRDPDPLACASRSGCSSPEFEDAFCDAPCPDVQTSTAVPLPPAPAAMPAPVRLGACDPPWMSVTPSGGDGITTCEPPPVAATATCALDQAQMYLAAGCAPIGDLCGGDYAMNLSTIAMGRPTLYVKANAPAGGNGTIMSPFARIQDALSAAAANTVVALSRGTFAEAVEVPAGVVLVGACTGSTAIVMPASINKSAVVHFGAGGGLWNVGVTAATGLAATGVAVTGGSVQISGVVVHDVGGPGITLDGPSVEATLEGVLVRRSIGDGIEASGGAMVHVSDAAIVGGRGTGVHGSTPSTSLVLDRVSVRERLEDPTTSVGGVYVERGAELTADGLLLFRAANEGLRVDGATVDVRNIYVVDTQPGATTHAGFGVHISAAAHATVHRASIANNASFGIVVDAASTTARIDEVVLRGNAPNAGDAVQHGIIAATNADAVIAEALFDGPENGVQVTAAATASISQAVFRGGAIPSIADAAATIGPVSVDGGARYGIEAIGTLPALTTIAIHDATVTNIGGMPGDREASGIRIHRAHAVIDHVLIERTGGNGVYASGGPSDVRVSDATLLDTGTSSAGVALWAIDAPIRAERIFIRRPLGLAIHVFNYARPGDAAMITTATCALSDVDIDEPRGDAPGLWIENRIGAHLERVAVRHAGGGFYAVGGSVITAKDILLDSNALFGATILSASTLRLERSVLSNNKGFGVRTAYTSNPQLPAAMLTDVRILDTGKDAQDGSGVGVKTDYANVVISRFVIDRSEVAGVSIDEAGGLDLSEGTISSSPLGARVTLDGFDRWRLLDRVRFVGVGAPLGP